MRAERRQRRSASPSVALGYFLDDLARTERWDAVALADDDGLLIGAGRSSSTSVDPEGIAAVAPMASRERQHPPDGLLGLVTRGGTLTVWGVNAEGTRLHLAAVGAIRSPPAATYEALGRILGMACNREV